MNIYEQIVQGIKQVGQVVTKYKDGFIIWNSIISGVGIRCSGHYDTIEGCKEYIGDYYYSEQEILDIKDLKIVQYLPFQPIPYEVGTLVDILDSVEDCDDYKNFSDKTKELLKQKGLKIDRVDNYISGLNYLIYNKDESNCDFISHHHLVPHIPQGLSKEEQESIDIVNRLSNEGKVKGKVEVVNS